MDKQNKDSLLQSSPEFLLKLKGQIPQMNPAQRRIAQYMIAHFNDLEGIPIGLLAKNSDVSEATVSRFVKFLGYKSYRDFQMEILKNGISQQKDMERARGYETASKSDSASEICYKVFEANIQCLMDTMSIIDLKTIEKAACAIAQKRKLVIFAQGRSKVAADSIRLRLYRLNIQCTLYSDPHEQAIVSSLLKEGDVVMGISTFGRSESVVKNIRRAADSGAFVIGVSSYEGTPLEKNANVMLISSSSEDGRFGLEPSTSTVSQMVLLDCLYIIICSQMKDAAGEYLEATSSAIAGERGIDINHKMI